MNRNVTRREFIQTSSAIAAAGALGVSAAATRAQSKNDTRLRVLSIGVVGTIGRADRLAVSRHPKADIVGLCDVDENHLKNAAKNHPKVFQCSDYREAFDKHGSKFDAVIVSTPDHSHAPIVTRALSENKHVYGQKPLVHQLEELNIIEAAIKAKPDLVTQTGAQRIASPARRAAVDILKDKKLGKVKQLIITNGGRGALAGGRYFADGKLGEPIDPPKHINYDLWLCGNATEPCRPNMLPVKWRSWWKYGGGMIADWIVHLSDVFMYAYPQLTSPVRVTSKPKKDPTEHFHGQAVHATMTYNVSGDHFASSTCNLDIYDAGGYPDRKSIGLGQGKWPGGGTCTIAVCEGGTLVLAPAGPLEVWRDGKKEDGLKMSGLPKYERMDHWHAWVDKCLGIDTPHHWCPFEQGIRCTEPGLLSVKAAKYPGQMLHWDRKSLTFTNHKEATQTIVKREYRKGFEPIRL